MIVILYILEGIVCWSYEIYLSFRELNDGWVGVSKQQVILYVLMNKARSSQKGHKENISMKYNMRKLNNRRWLHIKENGSKTRYIDHIQRIQVI